MRDREPRRPDDDPVRATPLARTRKYPLRGRLGHGGFSLGESERREFQVRFFNERDVDVGLWEARLEFYEGNQIFADPVPDFADVPAGDRCAC